MGNTFPSEVWADVLYYAAGPGAEREGMADRERRELRDTRLAVVSVCRGWKRASVKFLYSSPLLTSSSSLVDFSAALHAADHRWDSLRRSPHSTPGAYVRTLDVSHLRPTPGSSAIGDIQNQPWMLNSLLCSLLPLLPFLTKLVLPSGIPGGGPLIGGGMFLRALKAADCSAELRVLEGLGMLQNGVIDLEGKDPVVALLQGLPRLESLGLIGGGQMDLPPPNITPDAYPQPALDLPHLHTLSLRGVQTGLLLHTLIASDLPALKHLGMSSYHTTQSDLTTPFLATHGPSLLSLAYLALPDFPRPILPLPLETLLLCPSLVSLDLHIPASHPPPGPLFFDNPTAIAHSSLTHLSLPRPAKPALYDPLITSLRAIDSLREVVIQGFTYVPAGSPAALGAGLNGVVRDWAVALGRRGVVLRDSRGRSCPGLVQGSTGLWLVEDVRGGRGAVKATGARPARRSSWDEEESEGGG